MSGPSGMIVEVAPEGWRQYIPSKD
jgi:hypothetical protein